MKRTLRTIFMFLMAFTVIQLSAQTRYLDPQFDVSVTSDVKYGENYEVLTGAPILIDLLMDVYEPAGDMEARRPLVIMAHAGSFLPKGLNTLPFGNRKDSANIEICREFARRGYVCASIDYRLGWNPLAPTQLERAESIIQATFRASQDMVTAVRFFAKDGATDNLFRTDSTRVVAAGNNSGGYMALTSAYLNRPEELVLFKFLDDNGVPFVQESVEGNIDGTGGNPALQNYSHPGFSTNVHMVLNLGGALGDSIWLDQSDQAALVSFQERNNPLTPYGTAVVIVTSTGDPIVEVSGGGALHPYIDRSGISVNDVMKNAVFDDPFTQAAQDHAIATGTTYSEGLFTIPSAVFFYDPWAWYDPNDPNIDNTTPGASGFGSAANPFNTPQSARLYIDTIMGYFNPRACVVLDLPCAGDFTSTEDLIKGQTRAKLFPNPANKQFTLQTDQTAQPIIGIRMYDLMGKVITDVNNLREYNIDVKVPNLSPGMYMVNVVYEDGIQALKVMIR
ncbi:MAG: T9SS type A sorting domain-containing protein [Bacteroidota bacterium]